MSPYAAIVRNAAWLCAGRILSLGITLVMTVVLARRLGLIGLGEYAFVAAVVILANVATTFGTDMVLMREIAAGGSMTRWSAALAVQLGLSLGAIGLIWLAAPLIPGQNARVVDALRIYSLSLIPSALFSVCTAALRGGGRMGWQAVTGVAAAAIQLVAAWLFIAPGMRLDSVAIVLLAVQLADGAVAWIVCASLFPAFRGLPRASATDVTRMIGSTASIGLLGLLGVLYQRAGMLVLAVAAGPAGTGWFAGASRIVEGSKTGHVAFFAALYPLLARAHAGLDDRDTDAIARSRRLSVLGAAALSVALIAASPLLVDLLYGPAFAPSAAGLSVLALAIVPSTLATFSTLELVAAHREGFTVRSIAISLAVLGGLLAVLIPLLGWIGACWAIVGAEVVQAGTLLLVCRRVLARPATRTRTVSLGHVPEGVA